MKRTKKQYEEMLANSGCLTDDSYSAERKFSYCHTLLESIDEEALSMLDLEDKEKESVQEWLAELRKSQQENSKYFIYFVIDRINASITHKMLKRNRLITRPITRTYNQLMQTVSLEEYSKLKEKYVSLTKDLWKDIEQDDKTED